MLYFIVLISLWFSYTTTSTEQPAVTIWIHGTMFPMPEHAKKSFCRKDLGLCHIKEYKKTDHLYIIAQTLHESDPNHFALEHFYTFGWSGQLSFVERKKAAYDLYEAITTIINDYNLLYNQIPYIRIIGHSHAGNVILNLAYIMEQLPPITIDEIILLATPVQEETESYLAHDCFKKVYAFYSQKDIIQVLDPQALYKNNKSHKLYSHRTFEHHEKLYQAAIKIKDSCLMHIDFIRVKFIRYLSAVCTTLDDFYNTLDAEQQAAPKVLNIIGQNDDTTAIIQKSLILH